MIQNKVFASPYKNEIEQRLAIGQSPRAISKWLETRGEKISYATINEYKKEYFNFEKKAAEAVEKKQEELGANQSLEELEAAQKSLIQTEMNKAVGAIKAVNHIAVLYENIQDMRQYLFKLQNYEPIVAAHAAKGLYQEIRATIETLEKIKANQNEGDDSSVARMLSRLKSQKKELEMMTKEKKSNEEV